METGLNLTLRESPKTGVLATRPTNNGLYCLQKYLFMCFLSTKALIHCFLCDSKHFLHGHLTSILVT